MDVDLTHNVVRVGEREWPVTLNVSTGTLTVHLTSATYHVRPLTWGEKRTLARYAFLGEEFLKRQLVATCTTPHAVPDGTGEDQALVQAAVWMTAPEGDHLPLSSGPLLRATTDIERWTGTPSLELDGQPAADVEALWLTLASESSRVMRHQRSAVSPMPPPLLPSTAATRPADSVAPHPLATAPLAEGWQRIVVVPETAGTAHETNDKPAPETLPRAAKPDDLPSPPPTASAEAPVTNSRAFAPLRRGHVNRYRIFFGSASPTAATSIAPPSSAVASFEQTPMASQQPLHTPVTTRQTGPRPGHNPAEPTRVHHRAPIQPNAGPIPAHQHVPPRTHAEPAGPDLLDTFAQQLEEAASAVGIDLQG